MEVVWCKLDRVLCNEAWVCVGPTTYAHFSESGVSDHSCMELMIEDLYGVDD